MGPLKDLLIFCIDALGPAEELGRRFSAKFPDIKIHKVGDFMDFFTAFATQKFRIVVIIASEKLPGMAKYIVDRTNGWSYPFENIFVYHLKPSTIQDKYQSKSAEFVEGDEEALFTAVKNAAEKDTNCYWKTYADTFMARLDV